MASYLDFRPDSYWSTESLLSSLEGSIGGTWRRTLVNKVLGSSDVFPLLQHLLDEQLPDEMKSDWGRIHPSFMGGEYLPKMKPGEVEIARIEMKSVTADVISIRARPTRTRIYYSIVDEYDTVPKCSRLWSNEPLTLQQVISFIQES